MIMFPFRCAYPRRLFSLVFPGLLLLALLPSEILAQGGLGGGSPATCTVSATVTPTLRAEGVSERIGDLVLVCTGGTPTAAGVALPTSDITIYLNTAITNRLYSNGWSD